MLQYVVDAILLHFRDALQGGQYHRSHQQDDFQDVPFCQILSSLRFVLYRENISLKAEGMLWDGKAWKTHPSFIRPSS